MNKRLLCTLFVLALFGLSVSASANDEAAVSSTVDRFYKLHRSRSGLMSTHELNLRKGWFTAELTRLFQNEIKREEEFVRKNPDEKPYFGDGFPFQPYEECVVNEKLVLNRLELGKVKLNGRTATIDVKFFIPEQCAADVPDPLLDSFQIELTRGTTGKWLINDWMFADGRLSAILKREKY